jgi:hypothetical protein
MDDTRQDPQELAKATSKHMKWTPEIAHGIAGRHNDYSLVADAHNAALAAERERLEQQLAVERERYDLALRDLKRRDELIAAEREKR